MCERSIHLTTSRKRPFHLMTSRERAGSICLMTFEKGARCFEYLSPSFSPISIFWTCFLPTWHTHTTGTSIVAIPKHPYFNHILFLNMFLLYVNTHMQIHTQRNLLCPSSYLTSDKVKLLKCITSYIHANTWRIKWHTPYSGMFTAIFYCQPRQMPSNEPRNSKYSANAELL